MMKKRHILHWAMGVVMTPLLGSCAFDELHEIAGYGNGVLSFGVEVNAGAPEVKPMGGATRSGDRADSSATGSAVMSPDVEGFFPTSSVELSSVDGNAIYANCDERRGIRMHNNVDYKATRGSIKTQDDFYGSFALYGYVYDSGKTWASDGGYTSVDTNINGVEMTKGSDNIWKASNVYWPGASKKATFFAVAPKDCSGASITASQDDPKVIYTVPQTVSEQEDLLVAESKDITCDGKNASSLTFNHALAAIKFESGTLPSGCSVKNVEISGVSNKGELSSFESPAWSNQSNDGSGTNIYTISDLSNVLFLMPQTFTDDAQIKLTLSDDSYYTAKLNDGTNTSWQAGHQYTYKLSVNKVTGTFNFEVSPSTASIPIAGGTATFTVKSYFKYQDNTIANIPWTGTYNIDGTAKTASGQGGDTGETVTINIGNNSSTSSPLTTNPSKGTTDKPWNLSNSQGEAAVENTANCYVVNSKGTYSIPLVYGCAIKNGSDNTLSYNKSTYVNHAETQISSPYIYSMVNNVDGAKLVWQDVQNMVAVNSSLGDNGHSLIFTIGDNIAQGNAVVAATAGGTVVWSWHIWVTDRDVSVNAAIPTKAFDTSKIYYFMPVPLGWCDGTTSTVAPRNVTLSLTQGQSGKNLSASIAQAGSTATSGNFTYYQWGRKDPFVGSTGSGNTTKTWYDGNGTTNNTNPTTTSQTSKAESIKYPEKFISGSSTWDTSTTYDNWNAKLESTTAPNTPYNYDAVEKTVYDPSPVGYKLPATMAFSGFTQDGKNHGSTENSLWNVKSTTMTNNGYEFYTQGWKTEPTDFWIAGGYRHYNNSGSLNGVGSGGLYWSAGPNSNTYGCGLSFNSGLVYPQSRSYRANGFSVRPVSE